MKRLIFSDLHLHPWSYGSSITKDGFNSRLWAQKLALDEMLVYAKEHDIRYAYFLGDLFHTHGSVPTQALSIAADFFRKLREQCAIRAIAGNHDQANKRGNIHTLEFLHKEEFISESNTMRWFDEGTYVYGLPYTEDEDTIKRFLDACSDTGGLALLHQGVMGVQLSSGYIIDERLTPEMIPDNCFTFSGHYHFHRRVSPNLTVVGNLTSLNWSDANQPKGFVIYDDATGQIDQIGQTVAPNFVSLDSPSQGDEFIGDFVRINYPVALNDQEEIRQAFLKEGALTVEFPHMLTEQSETAIMKSGDEMTVEHLIKALERKNIEPRRLEIGQEIRKANYETPTLPR